MEELSNIDRGAQPEQWTALVIDDEAMIRHLIRRTLEPGICRVAEADSGEVGLRIIQQAAPPVDVVLTDIRMPGLTGWDIAEVLARLRPDIPVGVISGYGGPSTPAMAGHAGRWGARLLLKPFTANALTDLARSLVADAQALRMRSLQQRAPAEPVRETNALVRWQRTGLRHRLDLVAAAWEVHDAFRRGRNRR